MRPRSKEIPLRACSRGIDIQPAEQRTHILNRWSPDQFPHTCLLRWDFSRRLDNIWLPKFVFANTLQPAGEAVLFIGQRHLTETFPKRFNPCSSSRVLRPWRSSISYPLAFTSASAVVLSECICNYLGSPGSEKQKTRPEPAAANIKSSSLVLLARGLAQAGRDVNYM